MGILATLRDMAWTKPRPPVPGPQRVAFVPPELFQEIHRLKDQADWIGRLVEDEERAFTYGEDGTIQFGMSQGQPNETMFDYKWAYSQAFFRPGYFAAFCINEAQYRIIRARSRAFCSINPYWHGVQHNLKTHVAGKGHKWTLVPRDPKSKPPQEKRTKAQQEIDEFYDGTGDYAGTGGYRHVQQEKLDRKSRDGEYFLQYVTEDDRLRVRFIEPLLVWTPSSKSEQDDVWFGIQFKRGEYERPLGYYVRRTDLLGADNSDQSAWERMIDTSQIQHRKINVDRSSPRGIPDTYWVQSRLEQSMRTLRAMGTLVQIRTKIALIRKRVNALTGSVQPMLSANAMASVAGPGGQIHNISQYPEGAILDTSDQAEYQFPGQNIETDKIVASIQADLQAVATSVGLADYMVSGALGSGSYACHDTETELLTRRGWLRWNQVTENDVAGTMNPQTRAFEWQKINSIYRNEFSGEMISIRSRDFDLLVTPNHRIWCQPQKESWQFRRADDIPWFASLPMRTAPKDGVAVDSIVVPGAGYIRNLPGGSCEAYPEGIIRKRQSDVIVDANALLSFIGWWISEGCASSGYTVSLNQNTGALMECESIERAISGMPFKFGRYLRTENWEYNGQQHTLTMRTWKANNKTLWTWLREHCGYESYTKKIPDFVHDLGSEQQQHVLQSLKLGDGHDRNERLNVYTTMSQQLADDLQALAAQCGERARISIADARGRYRISLRQCKDACFDKNWSSRVQYDGMVWCVSVPNGILITRRNGKMAITGNTAMVSEGPVVKTFEQYQEDMVEEDREVAARVLEVAMEAGRLDENTLEVFKLEMTGPPLARQGIQQAQANQIEVQCGVLSVTTWQQRLGLDPETEAANIKANPSPLTMAATAGGDGTQPRNRQTDNARPFSPDEEGRQVQRASGATKEEATDRLGEHASDDRGDVKPTVEDLAMAVNIITPEWLDITKRELLGLPAISSPIATEYAPGVTGVLIGRVDNQSVWAVDMDAMTVLHRSPDLVVAANSERWPFVPREQIWVDLVYDRTRDAHIALHELIEFRLMSSGWSYARAHRYANNGPGCEMDFLLALRPELAALKPKE